MGILRIVTLLTCLGSALSCTSTSDCTSECYVKLDQNGCQAMLQTMGAALQAQNVTRYCNLADTFQTCLDNTFAECDQNLDKSTFSGGMDETYASLCRGSPVDKCRMNVVVCTQALPQGQDGGMPGCGAMKQYLDCLKEKMKTCDNSVSLESVAGPMEDSYKMQCGGAGGVPCNGIGQCMAPLMGAPKQGDEGDVPTVDIVKQCDMMGTLLSCLHTEQTKCNATMTRSYSFGQVAGLFTEGCKLMSSNNDVLKCDQFTRCMDTFKFPSDPAKLAKLTSDPQIWCSMMKSVMECSSKSPECKSDRSDFESFLKDINEVCPEAEIMVTAEGSGSIIYPGVLAVLIASLAALLTSL